MHAFLHHHFTRFNPLSPRSPLLSLQPDSLSSSMSSSSIVLPSISLHKRSSDSLKSSNYVCFAGFKHGIRGFGHRNLGKSRVSMSVSVGSQTSVNDALFADYKPMLL